MFHTEIFSDKQKINLKKNQELETRWFLPNRFYVTVLNKKLCIILFDLKLLIRITFVLCKYRCFFFFQNTTFYLKTKYYIHKWFLFLCRQLYDNLMILYKIKEAITFKILKKENLPTCLSKQHNAFCDNA